MQTTRIRELLNHHESTTLDFKRDQYRLTNDEEKSELIKDLLAFANTPRTSDAHIIIGIAEAPTPPHTITGITEPLLDHHLQQLVNTKLNRPITFSYETHRLNGATIGIITIKRRQTPPHHLTRDFGKLKKDTVYVRRGSSTAIATLDEITSLTRPARAPRTPRPADNIQALALTAMYRHDEMIVARGGRGIAGFSYSPPERHSFSRGEYVRLDAKLLITPSTPLVLVSALSTATIKTADNTTIALDRVTFEENAETLDIPTARVIRIKGEHRVHGDVLQPSRASGVTIRIALAAAGGNMLQHDEHLTWTARTEAFSITSEDRE